MFLLLYIAVVLFNLPSVVNKYRSAYFCVIDEIVSVEHSTMREEMKVTRVHKLTWYHITVVVYNIHFVVGSLVKNIE